jgi:hypothetical protein
MDKGLPFPPNLILEAVEFRSRAVAIKGPLQLIEERHRLSKLITETVQGPCEDERLILHSERIQTCLIDLANVSL